MGKLNLSEIQEGMTLAADVLDRTGRVLLKGGLQVTQKHLTILKQWGVTEADIDGADRDEINTKAAETLDQGALKRYEARFQEVFSQVNRDHPFNKELFRLSVLRAVTRTTGEPAGDNQSE